jgi:uncharacterized protein GlcG (DUF336 family)
MKQIIRSCGAAVALLVGPASVSLAHALAAGLANAPSPAAIGANAPASAAGGAAPERVAADAGAGGSASGPVVGATGVNGSPAGAANPSPPAAQGPSPVLAQAAVAGSAIASAPAPGGANTPALAARGPSLTLAEAAVAGSAIASAPAPGGTNTPAPAARGPSLDLALEAAQTAVQTCKGLDQKIGVTVVDSAGVLKVFLATDGASTRGVASSTNKALTSLAFGASTSELGEKIKTDTSLAEKISANSNYNTHAGGLLLKVGSDVIGAIGVGGAKGSEKDESCALAGLQKIQSRLK